MFDRAASPYLVLICALTLTTATSCSDDPTAPGTDAGVTDGALEGGSVDGAPLGTVKLSSATFEASEIDAEATITVVREGSSAGEVSVEYATADDSAKAGEDYEESSGTLTWADGEDGEKQLTVSLNPDFRAATDKTLKITLSAVSGAELGSPDTATLTLKNQECEEISSNFTEDTTLDGPCYLVTDRVHVTTDSRLTISPGVTLLFEQDMRLTVQNDCELHAEGTAEKPIRLTGVQQTAGYWEGLAFANSDEGKSNKLAHVIVEHGGGEQYNPGNIAVKSKTKISIDDCTMTHSAKYGIWISDEAIIDSFTNNTMTLNEGPPAYIYAATAWLLDPSSTYKGNAEDVVIVDNYGSHANVAVDQTWHALDVPYLVTAPIGVHAHLTIEAGTTVQFDGGTRLVIATDAALTAEGTAAKPITLTGKQHLPGYWLGVAFSNSNDVNNKLMHVTIEDGGGDEYHPANLVLQYKTRASIDHCTFKNSKKYGFWLSEEVIIDSFKNNTSTANQGPAGFVYAEGAGSLDDTAKFTGNAEDHVIIDNYGSHANVQTPQTWAAIDVPYLVTAPVGVHAHLTIQAGATLIFANGIGLSISDGGALTAAGTSGNPITFTGQDKTAGSWPGIFIWTMDSNNQLDHTVVEYGGGDTYHQANVVLRSVASASVKNSQIRHSSGHGIWASYEASLDQSDNTFTGIAQDDVFQQQP